ncbi:MAG TPA: SirB2 family protein [Steroidobacteraceae bacterium]|nr:SirB2 family protein [Steroidobacteraceae bacterium]HNS28759.1 SirB2 family protein [Steroidobacteraceae bacterium]
MAEFYPWIKWVHVAAVVASGSLFFVRGLASHLGAGWTMAAPLRYLSYTIDTVLLTAALALTTIVRQYPYMHDWLTVKLLLLIVYIVLGSFALRRGATRGGRIVFWVAALVVLVMIISVARARHPLGLLHDPASLDLHQRALADWPPS